MPTDRSDEETADIDPLLRQALDGAEEAIAIYTVDDWVVASTIVYANRALCELSGYAEEHFVGHSALLLAGARPHARTLDSILPPAGRHELRSWTEKCRPDNSTYNVDVWVRPLRDSRGKITHYLSTQRRIVSPRTASEGAARRDGDASLSQLAAGVAYEFEALTSSCLTSLAVARDVGARDESPLPAIATAERAVASMAATVRGLKAFATEDGQETTELNVHEALELALRLSGPVVHERATIERRYASTALVKASAPRLARVFTSILRNAGESIPVSMPGANHVTVETGHDAEGNVRVVISDTGVGIEPDDLPFVCDPFFTTKRTPLTAGLGLASARAEISNLGGELCVESRVGHGTRVVITLPSRDVTHVSARAPSLVTSESPSLRLLSVADTHAAAFRIAQPFTSGPIVLTVATWPEALERLALAERFDLVVCDARRPRSDEFRAQLRELAPTAAGGVFEMSVAGHEDSGIFARLTDVAQGVCAK